MRIGIIIALAFVEAHAQSYSTFSFDPPPGMTLAVVKGLNTAGQTLGAYLDSAQAFHWLLRSADGVTYTPIEVPGATSTQASGLNNLGQVAGSYADAAGTHSFVRGTDGTYSKFDIPPSETLSQAPVPTAINDKGDLAGTASSGAGTASGFLLSADRKTYTPFSVATVTQVTGIDNDSNVYGTARIGGSFRLNHGFVRKADGSFRLIDGPGLLGGSMLLANNNRGQVILGSLILKPDGTSAALDPTLGGVPMAMAIDDNGRVAGCLGSGTPCRGFLGVPSTGSGPVIRPVHGVISAVSFAGFETIAPGSWIEIYGSNLSKTTRQWQTSDFNGNSAPTSLDDVSVTINGRRAFVSYVSPGQVNAQVPSTLTPGMAQVTVTNGGQTSLGYQATVAATEPGLLATAEDVASVYALPLFPDFGAFATPNFPFPTIPPIAPLPTRLAKAGDTVIFYGIGFGGVTPNLPAGQIATQPDVLQGTFEMSFLGTPAQVNYAGLAPGSVGLYQFNVVMPDGVHGEVMPEILLNGVPLTQRLTVVLQ